MTAAWLHGRVKLSYSVLKWAYPSFKSKLKCSVMGYFGILVQLRAVRRFKQSSDAHFGGDGTTSRGLLH